MLEKLKETNDPFREIIDSLGSDVTTQGFFTETDGFEWTGERFPDVKNPKNGEVLVYLLEHRLNGVLKIIDRERQRRIILKEGKIYLEERSDQPRLF